jgi:hypothetical protein
MSPPDRATAVVSLYQHNAVSCGSATCGHGLRRRDDQASLAAARTAPRATVQGTGPAILVSTAKCQTRPMDRLTATGVDRYPPAREERGDDAVVASFGSIRLQHGDVEVRSASLGNGIIEAVEIGRL